MKGNSKTHKQTLEVLEWNKPGHLHSRIVSTTSLSLYCLTSSFASFPWLVMYVEPTVHPSGGRPNMGASSCTERVINWRSEKVEKIDLDVAVACWMLFLPLTLWRYKLSFPEIPTRLITSRVFHLRQSEPIPRLQNLTVHVLTCWTWNILKQNMLKHPALLGSISWQNRQNP